MAVEHDGKTMCAVLPWAPGPDTITESALAPMASILALLARRIPVALRESGERRPALESIGPVIAYGIPVVVMVVGPLAMAEPAGKPVDALALTVLGGAGGFVLAVLHSGVAALLLRGRATSHREWIKVTMLSVVSLTVSGLWLAPALNSRLDTGTASEVEVRAIGRRVVPPTSRKEGSYITVGESWRGRGTEEIDDGTLYASVFPGTSVVVIKTRPGFLGYEWIESIRVKRRP